MNDKLVTQSTFITLSSILLNIVIFTKPKPTTHDTHMRIVYNNNTTTYITKLTPSTYLKKIFV